MSFPPPVEAPLPRPERCALLLWLLGLSADGDVSSSSCRSLNRDSSLSQINTDTPAGQQETAFISCPPRSAPDPGASPWCCWGTHPSQSQSHHPENWIYWSVNKYLRCVKDTLDLPIKVKGYQCMAYIHHSLTPPLNQLLESIPEKSVGISWKPNRSVCDRFWCVGKKWI